VRLHGEPRRPRKQPHGNSARPDRKKPKLAFSPDFRDHRIFEPIYTHRDRDPFEIIQLRRGPNPMTTRDCMSERPVA
jgi:hypothetical protein